MRDEHAKKEGRHRGGRHGEEKGTHQRGAKTFRRGRALAFLERMYLKRATIKQQLEQPEFQSIQPILVGELKAIDMVINEFVQLFDIHEEELDDGKQSVDANEEGNDLDEKN